MSSAEEVKPTETAPAASTEAPAPASASASSESAKKDEAAAVEEVEGAESTAEYQPLVSLKPVEVTTGEEHDEVLYKQRAACYRFDATTNEWKERGRGDVKILQNKDSGMVRLLLRQEKTLKLCMNHKILPDIELVPNAGSDRSWTWRTMDYSTEEAEKQTFALRLKDAEVALEFKKKYDEGREINAKLDKEKDTKGEGEAAGSADAAAEADKPKEEEKPKKEQQA